MDINALIQILAPIIQRIHGEAVRQNLGRAPNNSSVNNIPFMGNLSAVLPFILPEVLTPPSINPMWTIDWSGGPRYSPPPAGMAL